jgi:hypothetical protein
MHILYSYIIYSLCVRKISRYKSYDKCSFQEAVVDYTIVFMRIYSVLNIYISSMSLCVNSGFVFVFVFDSFFLKGV